MWYPRRDRYSYPLLPILHHRCMWHIPYDQHTLRGLFNRYAQRNRCDLLRCSKGTMMRMLLLMLIVRYATYAMDAMIVMNVRVVVSESIVMNVGVGRVVTDVGVGRVVTVVQVGQIMPDSPIVTIVTPAAVLPRIYRLLKVGVASVVSRGSLATCYDVPRARCHIVPSWRINLASVDAPPRARVRRTRDKPILPCVSSSPLPSPHGSSLRSCES